MGKYKRNRLHTVDRRSNIMKIFTAFIGICAVFGAVLAYAMSSSEVDFQDADFKPLTYFRKQSFAKLIIDVDAGGDDAVAMLLGLVSYPERILAITTCVGNTDRDQVNKNVLRILKVANSTIPVYSGAESAILKTPPSDNFYGKDGLGDIPDPNPPNMSQIQSEHAVNFMIRLVKENPNEISIIALGPLTNIALATRLDPDFRKNIKAIFWTGGSTKGFGNIKPGIEFNAYIDPIANYITFNSYGPPVIMITSELFMVTSKTTAKWRREILGKLNSPEIQFLNEIEHLSLGSEIWNTADSKTLAIALNPRLIIDAKLFRVEAIWDGEDTRGAFMVDYRGKVKDKPKNAIVIEEIDIEGFKNMLIDNFGKKV